MLHRGNTDLRNSSSSLEDIMAPPELPENGNIPQTRRFPCCQVAFYILIFGLIIISVLISAIFFLLHPKQAPGRCWAHGICNEPCTSDTEGVLVWVWNLEHCDGFVQQEHGQYLIIKQSGNYFIYGQINRKENMTEAFTVMLFKAPNTTLNKAVGSNQGHKKGSVNFGRPFFLQKGDKLYCKANFNNYYIEAGNQTYWGLYKI